jgi:Phosphodiester glycosidase
VTPTTSRRRVSDSPPPRRPRPAARRRGRRVALVALIAAVLLAVPAVSFVRAMTYPGSAPATVRAVEWVREHGGGGLVDFVETWLYSHTPPAAVGSPQDRLASPAAPPSRSAVARGALPPRIDALSGALQGEGRWLVARRDSRGEPSLFTTWFRPDPAHRPVVVGVAMMPRYVDRLHLGAGTREPVPGLVSTARSQVPEGYRNALVAVFNSGFKMRDSGRGGWYLGGRTVLPLRAGLASLVIDRNGTARVGVWGRDFTMNTGIAAVRQNLHLIVQHGRTVAGLATNYQGLFGTGRNQFQYTWRSGIGTDRHGDLIYVAGQGLTLSTLAQAMSRVGIVTGMELDIHGQMVAFNTFSSPADVLAQHGHRLLRGMNVPRGRYLVPDQRDFFYVTQG